jgi:serine/threonine protein kinase
MAAPSIEGFELGARIGRGALGTVYVARKAPSEGRAAVKIFDQAHVSRQQSTLLFNEAVAASSIRQASTADIVDLGQLPNGRPYVAMELLRGESLATRLRRIPRLPLAEALDFGRQAASALAAAHEEGIVHGALKPENLFLVPDLSLARAERVKVLDFGTRRLHARARADRTPGPCSYVAPEQGGDEGEFAEIDQRADVYALGAFLYHVLCGVNPVLTEAIRATRKAPRGRPLVAPRALNRAVPAAVDEAILRALASRPEDRFDSMPSLLDALTTGGRRRSAQPRLGWAGAALSRVASIIRRRHSPVDV